MPQRRGLYIQRGKEIGLFRFVDGFIPDFKAPEKMQRFGCIMVSDDVWDKNPVLS